MKKIGCSKRNVWGKVEEGNQYCKDCGHTYDSKCVCHGMEFIYEKDETEKRIDKALEIAWQYGKRQSNFKKQTQELKHQRRIWPPQSKGPSMFIFLRALPYYSLVLLLMFNMKILQHRREF